MTEYRTGKTDRKSQKERSESMQLRVLEATLRCIGERGYSAVSLQDIADKAGVSRGAITHHYPSKNELSSAAIQYFLQWRHDRVHTAFEGKENLPLQERLDLLWREFQEIFPITFELIVALRSDKDLLALYRRSAKGRIEEITAGHDEYFPELARQNAPGVMVAVMSAFYRGAIIESVARDPAYVEQMKDCFQTMMLAFLDQEKKAA